MKDQSVIIDQRSGRRGSVAEWVEAFSSVWAAGRAELDGIMALLDRDIILSAPGLRPTRGQDASRAAFEKVFAILPDLTAEVLRWSTDGEALFIELDFTATIGRRPVTWRNVDRFIFRDGSAVERRAFFDPKVVERAFLGSLRGVLSFLRLRLTA